MAVPKYLIVAAKNIQELNKKVADTMLLYPSLSPLYGGVMLYSEHEGLYSQVLNDLSAPNVQQRFFKLLLSQSGVLAPVIDYQQANYTTPTLNYIGVGDYTIVSIGSFTAMKTFLFNSSSVLGRIEMVRVDNDIIQIKTFDLLGVQSNDILNQSGISIEIYP